MYEIVFYNLGLRLSFSELQVTVLDLLSLAPSHMRPSSIDFLWEFKIVCKYLEIGATLPLFFYYFHLQVRVSDGQFGRVVRMGLLEIVE